MLNPLHLALLTSLLTACPPAAALSPDQPSPTPSPDDAVAAEWSVAPSDASGPDGRVSLRHSVDPGASINDAIAVTNLGPDQATYTVSAGDGAVGPDGIFDIGGNPSDAGAWITVEGLENSTITVEAGETAVLPVRIDVPPGTLPGDHPAGIAVGMAGGQGVTVNHRVGVRLHLRVSGQVRADLGVKVTKTEFVPSVIPFWPGTLRVEYEVRNTGNVRLGTSGMAEATGPFGWGSKARPAGELRELLPGEAVPVAVTVTAPPLFKLDGQVEVTPKAVGEDDVVPPEAINAEFRATAISWSGMAALAAVVICLVIAVWRGLKRRRRARG
ncbi:MAG: hypothetical protein LBH48_06355 [Bifidobacteriaceae bacterium]|jgi:hypothetical protein|nr:hypothetical protein [Bifidobacteriaceae bacterium]